MNGFGAGAVKSGPGIRARTIIDNIAPYGVRMELKTVYVTIGNSDNRLAQQEWARFCRLTNELCREAAGRSEGKVFGEWYSNPNSQYQNACWSFEATGQMIGYLRSWLSDLANLCSQESIAMVIGSTELVKP